MNKPVHKSNFDSKEMAVGETCALGNPIKERKECALSRIPDKKNPADVKDVHAKPKEAPVVKHVEIKMNKAQVMRAATVQVQQREKKKNELIDRWKGSKYIKFKTSASKKLLDVTGNSSVQLGNHSTNVSLKESKSIGGNIVNEELEVVKHIAANASAISRSALSRLSMSHDQCINKKATLPPIKMTRTEFQPAKVVRGNTTRPKESIYSADAPLPRKGTHSRADRNKEIIRKTNVTENKTPTDIEVRIESPSSCTPSHHASSPFREPSPKLSLNIEPSSKLSLNREPSSKLSLNREPSSKLSLNREPSSKLSLNIEPSMKLSLNIELSPELSLEHTPSLSRNPSTMASTPCPRVTSSISLMSSSESESSLTPCECISTQCECKSSQCEYTAEMTAIENIARFLNDVDAEYSTIGSNVNEDDVPPSGQTVTCKSSNGKAQTKRPAETYKSWFDRVSLSRTSPTTGISFRFASDCHMVDDEMRDTPVNPKRQVASIRAPLASAEFKACVGWDAMYPKPKAVSPIRKQTVKSPDRDSARVHSQTDAMLLVGYPGEPWATTPSPDNFPELISSGCSGFTCPGSYETNKQLSTIELPPQPNGDFAKLNTVKDTVKLVYSGQRRSSVRSSNVRAHKSPNRVKPTNHHVANTHTVLSPLPEEGDAFQASSNNNPSHRYPGEVILPEHTRASATTVISDIELANTHHATAVSLSRVSAYVSPSSHVRNRKSKRKTSDKAALPGLSKDLSLTPRPRTRKLKTTLRRQSSRYAAYPPSSYVHTSLAEKAANHKLRAYRNRK